MGLRIVPSPTFLAKIPLTIAGEDEPAILEFEFRHKSPEALKEWFTTFGDRDTSSALADVVVRWTGGVEDEHGQTVPFSPANFRLFLSAHGPRAEDLLRGYIKELTESRQKN